jgi:hypothetical protein
VSATEMYYVGSVEIVHLGVLIVAIVALGTVNPDFNFLKLIDLIGPGDNRYDPFSEPQ